MSGQGTAELDFGAFPGSNEASVTVTGLSDITALSGAEAWVMAEASTDHTAADHQYVPLWLAVTCGTPTAGVGFTIYGRSSELLEGKYTVRYVWA